MQRVSAHGAEIPILGFGTWPMKGDVCRDAVAAALAAGYRHIDTAAGYENEREVGAAINASGIDREEIFITSKIKPEDLADGDMQRAAAESVERLGIAAVDMMLIHWPGTTVAVRDMIRSLNDVRAKGYARHIGLSNFNEGEVREAWRTTDTPLANLQLEFHPRLNQDRMRAVADEFGMAFTAYSPVGRQVVLDEPVILGIAERHGKTAAQVVLRWVIQQGIVTIPKSQTPSRIVENFQLFDFELSDADIAAIAGLARPDGRISDLPALQPNWDG